MPKSALPSAVADDDENLHCALIVPRHLLPVAPSVDDEPLLTYKQVAREVNMGEATVARWGSAKIIPSYLIGKRSRRYKLSEIREYIESCKVVCHPTPAEKEAK